MNKPSQSKSSKKIGDYLLIKKLGEGTTAKVFLAKHEKTGELIAMKRIQIELVARHKTNRDNLKSELYIMNKIKHPNVMHCKEFYESDHHYYILMEYCNKGTLEFLRSSKRKDYSEKESMTYMRQIMEGFKILRKYKVIHRDVKLENLLLHEDVLKISDFGVAKLGKDHARTKMVGTVLTMAPELMNVYDTDELDENYCSKVDLWSIGIVYFEILFGECPFYGAYIGEMMSNMKKNSGEKLELPRKVSREIEDLLKRLLVYNSKDRIEWDEFFKHPAFNLYPLEQNLKDLYKKYNARERKKQKERKRKKKNNSSQDNFGVFKRKQTVKMDGTNMSRFNKNSNSFGISGGSNSNQWNGSKKGGKASTSTGMGTPSKISNNNYNQTGDKSNHFSNSQSKNKLQSKLKKKVQLEASLSNQKINKSARNLREKFGTMKSTLDKSDHDQKNNDRSGKKSRKISNRKESNMSNYMEKSFGKLIKSKSRSRNNRSRSDRNKSDLKKRMESYKKSIETLERDNKTNSTSLLPSLKSNIKQKRLYRNKSNYLKDDRPRSNQRLNRSRKKMGSSSNLIEYEHKFRESKINNRNRALKLKEEQLRVQEEHRIDFNVRLVNNRYIHEKNKVMFINLSIKKIRELIKMNIYPDIEYNFYLTVIFLMKKAMVLADLTLESLKLKENIFEFEYFNLFLKSQHYKNIVQEFKADIPNFHKYFNYLVEWARSKKLPYFEELNSHIRRMQKTDGLSLGELDKSLREQLNVLKCFEIEEFAPKFVAKSQGKLNDISMNQYLGDSIFEIKRDFYQVLVKLKYSIYCERYFPYKINESFFDWKDFFEKIKGMSLDRMKKVVEKIQ